MHSEFSESESSRCVDRRQAWTSARFRLRAQPRLASQPRWVTKTRAGLTLLELMVVLVILSIVATVALQSLQPQVDSQRFTSASRLLDEIKIASIGPQQKYQVDGTPLISGFISDVGRLPEAFTDVLTNNTNPLDSPEILSELWNAESELATRFPYGFRAGPNQPVDYSRVRIPCGWRGPYMQLAIGANALKDPWGQSPTVLSDAKGYANTVQISLPASDNDNTPEELSIDLESGKVEVTGKVLLDNPDNSTVRVALLTPQPETSLTTLVVLDDEDPMPDSFRFRDVPVGLRAIVCEVDGEKQTKYLQVPHSGLTVCFDFQNDNQAPTAATSASLESND
ncbi:type II secretion system protein [Mariniblastus fucicola]|uniref:Uncharacterized protein n=1 Tax=Mariniblastus fucicola TaxID=980251 RepID=A0A5B9PC85_9BACT|nr:type II secretion system protein [Mariniblastus fucicola]QEG23099.1 hypothetical protein MFFC18_29940 [Mariniblastus fucicola]